MQIIPVIDVMGGIVVNASGGIRSQYQPLESILTSSCEPVEVISALLAMHDFKKIYIADLDAISDYRYDVDLYTHLHERFPDIEFWLDVGIRTREDWKIIENIDGIRAVLGSETLEELDLMTEPLIKEQGILSLDYQQDVFLGKSDLIKRPDTWPKDVIVMNLDYVGAGLGPDYFLLAKVKELAVDSRIVAAGGVRDERDLAKLAKQNIDATLVASALHKGNISTKVISDF